MGNNFSSKDFRTWVATRLAIEFYPEALTLYQNKSKRKFSNIVIKMVAEELGNTPTVCKNYYVHPTVFRSIDKQTVPNPNPFSEPKNEVNLSASEQLIAKLIS